jgi:roadblock/LC7 domain-containing protein
MTSKAFPYLIQGNNIVVVIGNKSHTISKTHITYTKVLEAIKAQDWDLVKDVIEPKKVVLNYGQGNVEIQGETLFWKGKELHSGLSVRMIQMLSEGFPIEPMVNFMENLFKNPSKRAVTELYSFLEKNNLPITPDGHFLAYKKVRENYFDVHSGTMDNSVGKVLEMERHEVDDNKDNTCSTGLHFCGMSYLNCFGGERTVIVKINPADVVSIPSDYNDAKGRTCRYEVIGELDVDAADAFTAPVQASANTRTTTPAANLDAVEAAIEAAQAARDGVTGRQLSMTKDAIRKREARARAKATGSGFGSWPNPKV